MTTMIMIIIVMETNECVVQREAAAIRMPRISHFAPNGMEWAGPGSGARANERP